MKKSLLAVVLAAAALASCDPKRDPDPVVPATTGVYVLSEGQFQKGDGAVSAFDKSTKSLTVDAFGSANSGAKLGDVVQDMGIVGNRGYVCVNGSRKVEVVSLPDFKSVKTIRNIEQPRYFVSTSATRGYVTSWRGPYTSYQAGKVMVIDLTTNTLIDSITVGRNPERPIVLGGSIYVPNSYDNTVSVIDASTNKVTSTITVSDGPTGVVADQLGNIWALCSGFTVYDPVTFAVVSSTPGALVRFAPASPNNQLKLAFSGGSPSRLRINPDKNQLYYGFGGAQYQMSTSATTLPTTPFIRRNFTGFAIDPRDNTIFAAVNYGSYTNNGRFLRYPATGGAPIDSFTVRVGPNGFAFY